MHQMHNTIQYNCNYNLFNKLIFVSPDLVLLVTNTFYTDTSIVQTPSVVFCIKAGVTIRQLEMIKKATEKVNPTMAEESTVNSAY